MSNPTPFQKAIRFEIIKTLVIVVPIVAGAIVFAVIIPSSNKVDWIDFLFYLIIGTLIVILQGFSHYFKMRQIREMQEVLASSASIPSTFTSSNHTGPKESIKIDEYAVAHCPSCGKSFTKKYKFCPGCGSCKIKGMV